MKSRILMYFWFTTLVCLLSILPATAQTTWYVDDDGPNDPGPGNSDVSDPLEDGSTNHPFDGIQEGIDAASNGDTVEVRDGTFSGTGNYLLNFSGKAILLQSENGAENCDIVGDGSAPGGVVFGAGEGPDSILRGFKIHYVYSDENEASSPIRIIDASPTIENNIIEDNHGFIGGGGIYCLNSNAVIQGNQIQGNWNLWGTGGGIRCHNSNPSILSNTIHGNYCDVAGGAIYCDSSSPEIVGNIISDNVTGWEGGGGGGIYCERSSSPVISGNTITGNTNDEGGYGGGICCRLGASPLVINNIISGNNRPNFPISACEGGGIYCKDSSPVIAGNLITGNVSTSYSDKSASLDSGDAFGAGISCRGTAAPTIVNNFIADNSFQGQMGKSGYGGGIFCGPGTAPVISNNTIIDNFGDDYLTSVHGLGIYCESSSAVVVNCIVRGNQPEEIGGCDGLVSYSNVEGGYPGPGNIDADPMFVTGPGGCFYLGQVATGQSMNSPCVDAGSGPAAVVCFSGDDEIICLDDLTTRIDLVNDTGMVDIGYHHGGGVAIPCPSTMRVDYSCQPGSGTLPFTTGMSVALENLYTGFSRRLMARIHVTVGGGGYIPNWRTGFTNVAAGSSYLTSWNQNLPSLGKLVGDNLFELVAEDVTPAPYNQPPYPPAGDTDTASCTVTGIAR